MLRDVRLIESLTLWNRAKVTDSRAVFERHDSSLDVCDRPNKGKKAIECNVISSFQVAQSRGFKADFCIWERLLRSHE
jgi:hypothetical protein